MDSDNIVKNLKEASLSEPVEGLVAQKKCCFCHGYGFYNNKGTISDKPCESCNSTGRRNETERM